MIFLASSPETFVSDCRRFQITPSPHGNWVITWKDCDGMHSHVQAGLGAALRWCLTLVRAGT